MSNIYITEPNTEGKVLLHTTFGDLDVELWPQQAPKACRNFVQLCLEGVRSSAGTSQGHCWLSLILTLCVYVYAVL